MKKQRKIISIELPEETLEQIEKIVRLENTLNEVISTRNRDTLYSTEDFIVGCINKQLEHIDKISDLSNFEGLGKPRELKNRIKVLAKEKGWNQKTIVDKTDINKGTVSTIFSNSHQPSADYLLRIWIALGCPPLEEMFYRE
jgi:DNA-binding XRE family transcriptional regulator